MVDVLNDPFKEVPLILLDEAYILRIQMKTLAAQTETTFPDQTHWIEQMQPKGEAWLNFLGWIP